MSKASEWATRVAAWRASGKTSKQFCKARGYSAGSLLWWSSELKRRAPAGNNPIALTRVVVRGERASARTSPPIVLHWGAARVEVPAGADGATLTVVLEVLDARSSTGERR